MELDMQESPQFNCGTMANLFAAVLCGFLTALIVHFFTGSFIWAFITYSFSGSVYFILFTFLSVRDSEKSSE